MKDLADTICALSTPPGRSGIAVVRVSGPASHTLVGRVFRGSVAQLPPRRALVGRIVDPGDGSELDEALVTCFLSPNSYTGEDMAEFSLHGSPVLVAWLLDYLCQWGARLADPGEFTLRAFLNGRIDLTQAEAVRDIIDATTLYQAQVAARQRSGALAEQLRPVKDMLIDSIVKMEAAVEFVEEDIPAIEREKLLGRLDQIRRRLRDWVDSYRQGRIIREGFSMAVVGRPNVGKSSVFNALLAQNRSIVAEKPGTTRDLVSEFTNLGGIPVRLQDTAVIHGSEDHVEKLGIDRSLEAIADADAILLVVDASRPRSQQDEALKQQLKPFASVAVFNKSDLESRWSLQERSDFAGSWPSAVVSAKTGAGIEGLRSAILEKLMGATDMPRDGMLITNLRHCHALESAEKDLEQASAALREGLSEEFALAGLHRGLGKLGEILGQTHAEDLLEEIFSRFCIGK